MGMKNDNKNKEKLKYTIKQYIIVGGNLIFKVSK